MPHAKAFLRKRAVRAAEAISNDEQSVSDLAITNNILSLRQYRRASVVFCFVGTGCEVDTVPVISDALSQNKRVCVPKCVSRGEMEAFEIKSFDDLERGKYNIMEPKYYCSKVIPDEIDFAIVPCVTCDTDGNRIGRGKGYYDRYLKHTGFVTAAVCRDILLSDNIPPDAHDIRIDIIVTDKCVHNTKSKNV